MGSSDRQNQIALLNAEIAAIDSELDIIYKEKLSELETKSKQPFTPDPKHPDKVVQPGQSGEVAKANAQEYMRTYKPAVDLAAGRAELVRRRDMLRGVAKSAPITWFRSSAREKIIKGPKPAKVMRVPKAPKTPAAPKPKKIVGPKSPQGFKKKLYIPKRLIQAGWGGPGADNSPAAVANLMRYMADSGLGLSYVEWVNPSPSERCDYGVCNELNGEMRIYDLSELLKGITGWSHEGCDCHIVVTLTNGESHKITVDDDLAHLQWVGAPQPGTDVTTEDQEGFEQEFEGVSPQQRHYMQQEGLEVVPEEEFERE